MSIIELVARTFSPPLPDRRFIFHPWGARGPCYQLSARQRTLRAGFQLALYVLAFAAICWFPALITTTGNIAVSAVVFLLANHVLFWLFSIGLPKIDPPPTLTPEQRRAMMTAHSRVMGRPLLWVFLLVSLVFTFAGLMMALFLGEWITGSLSALFFGACSSLFIKQLELAGKKSRS